MSLAQRSKTPWRQIVENIPTTQTADVISLNGPSLDDLRKEILIQQRNLQEAERNLFAAKKAFANAVLDAKVIRSEEWEQILGERGS